MSSWRLFLSCELNWMDVKQHIFIIKFGSYKLNYPHQYISYALITVCANVRDVENVWNFENSILIWKIYFAAYFVLFEKRKVFHYDNQFEFIIWIPTRNLLPSNSKRIINYSCLWKFSLHKQYGIGFKVFEMEFLTDGNVMRL